MWEHWVPFSVWLEPTLPRDSFFFFLLQVLRLVLIEAGHWIVHNCGEALQNPCFPGPSAYLHNSYGIAPPNSLGFQNVVNSFNGLGSPNVAFLVCFQFKTSPFCLAMGPSQILGLCTSPVTADVSGSPSVGVGIQVLRAAEAQF